MPHKPLTAIGLHRHDYPLFTLHIHTFLCNALQVYKYLYNHHHALTYLLSDMVVFLRGLLLVHVVCELLLGE